MQEQEIFLVAKLKSPKDPLPGKTIHPWKWRGSTEPLKKKKKKTLLAKATAGLLKREPTAAVKNMHLPTILSSW